MIRPPPPPEQARETLVRQLGAVENRQGAIKEFDETARPSPGERINDLETEYQALEGLVRDLDYGSDLSQIPEHAQCRPDEEARRLRHGVPGPSA